MKSGLYRIEVKANYLQSATDADRTNLPEPDRCAMIMDGEGITFAKLHRLSINAEPQKKDPGPCFRCKGKIATKTMVTIAPGQIEIYENNYCSQCGRYLDR